MPIGSTSVDTARGDSANDESLRRSLPDEDEFERLMLPVLNDVVRYARSLTRDAARTDDLVQETYLQALRGWHTFRIGADPKRWLLTICHHAFLRDVREKSRLVDAPDDDPELESLATAQAHYQAERDGVLQSLDRIDLGPAIDRAVGELPPHYRSVIVLVDVEGRSYEEAAAILDVAIGTIRSRLFRARRLLQDRLFEFARDAGIRVNDATLFNGTSPTGER
jgi:RNA polymerase sigma-70 factor (ECF subfamily)